jgi:hypothetical protein
MEREKQKDGEFLKGIQERQMLLREERLRFDEESRIQHNLKDAIAEAGFTGIQAADAYARFRYRENSIAAFQAAMTEAGLDTRQPLFDEPLLAGIGDPGLVFLHEYVRGLDEIMEYAQGIEGLPEETLYGLTSRIEALREDLIDQMEPDPRG